MKLLPWKNSQPFHIIPDLNNPTKEQLKYLRSIKPMICSPSREPVVCGNYHLTTLAIAKYAQKFGMEIDTQLLFGCSYIEQGRNTLANTFWNSDCTHLFFIDTDNGTMANHFFELLLCQKDIIGGLYPKRIFNWEGIHKAALAGVPPDKLAHSAGYFPYHMLKDHDVTIGHEPQKVLTLPTGFMCISRRALKEYVKAHPDRKTTPGNPGHFGIRFFRAGTFEGVDEHGKPVCGFDTEDNIFCKDLLRLGINTWLAPWVPVTHEGDYLFEACLACSSGAYIHTQGWLESQEKVANDRG